MCNSTVVLRTFFQFFYLFRVIVIIFACVACVCNGLSQCAMVGATSA